MAARWLRAFAKLVASVDAARDEPADLGLAVALALANPNAKVAASLSDPLLSQASKLTAEILGAVWLYCAVSGLERETERWGELLAQRIGGAKLPGSVLPLDHGRYVYLVNAIPLRRASIYGLMGALPAPRGGNAGAR